MELRTNGGGYFACNRVISYFPVFRVVTDYVGRKVNLQGWPSM